MIHVVSVPWPDLIRAAIASSIRPD